MAPDSSERIAVFVGPTAYGVTNELAKLSPAHFVFYPPIKRQDLQTLPAHYRTIVIVDGEFGSSPAVGHIELRKSLSHRTIYGCASMGAIRAYEMRDLGMIGFGQVYSMFFAEDDFTDDELAQLHGPGPTYRPVSEPLVNIRYFLFRLVQRNVVTAEMSANVITDLKGRYFGERTIELVALLLARYLKPSHLADLIASFPLYRIKTIDFLNLLRQLAGGGPQL